MFNPAEAANNIKEEYINYITTTLNFSKSSDSNANIFRNQFIEKLNNVVSKGPFVDINCVFKKGKTLRELINKGKVSPLFEEVEKLKIEKNLLIEDEHKKYKINMPLDRSLYLHQQKSIELLCGTNRHNAVITTGTGSGKTECFLYPLIDSLLREKENGTLEDPGVRAILIYPMNALANDQMKRLRNILMFYPDITFGVYTGDTEETDTKAKRTYELLHGNEKYNELKSNIPNELISRKQMQNRPPHILVTNYAMLEYMLLTPENTKVLNNSKIKFIILDEAHTYSGATGIETSLLIRRLLARINKGNIMPQFILTSATLGEKNSAEQDIIKFAENLTGGSFAEEDIIFGERETDISQLIGEEFAIDLFDDLAKSNDVKETFQHHGILYDDSISDKENIYNICEKSSFYKAIRQRYNKAETIETISNWLNISTEQTINFLFVCSQGRKNYSSLIDLKYHFFLRTMEGAYATFDENPKLFLNRMDEYRRDYNSEPIKVFEIAICKNCGDIAIVGKASGNPLCITSREKEIRGDSQVDEATYFRFCNDDIQDDEELQSDCISEEDDGKEIVDIEQENERNDLDNKEKIRHLFCPICGAIEETNEDGIVPSCGHGRYLTIESYKSAKCNRAKCLKCSNGFYNRFFIGTNAATSVLTDALFEELPIKDIIIHTDDGLEKKYKAGKQFLVFSDSRNDAAFFSSYASKQYEKLVSRRNLVQLLSQKKEDLEFECESVEDFRKKLTIEFFNNKTFYDDLLNDNQANMRARAINKSYGLLISEMMRSRSPESLQTLGFLKFIYLGNNSSVVSKYKNIYFNNLSPEDVKRLLDELVFTIVYFGAIDVTQLGFEDDEMKDVFFTSDQKGIVLEKTGNNEGNISSWLPKPKKNDSRDYVLTNRLKLVLDALGNDNKIVARQFLNEYFHDLINDNNEHHLVNLGNSGYAVRLSDFNIILPGNEDFKHYRCEICGRITTFNFMGRCNIKKCRGRLIEIPNIYDYYSNNKNYYHDFYNYNRNIKKYLRKMLMLEHTAQLSKRDAANYQIKFEKNSINALSCSTTFEMGVDVGELETVLMRDVPPSASNYVQRAGRAGRSVDSSAFVVTFAKLSSHDFTFFDEPTKMINGKILPPIFKIDNDHIVMRQIFSVVFGFFFNKYSDYYLDEDEKTKSIIDLVSKQGLIDLKNLLCVDDDMRRELSQELKRAFTSNNLDEIYNISNFRGEWVNNLISGIDSVIDYLIDKGRNQQEAVDIYNYLNPNVKYGRYVSALIDYYHTLFIYEDKIVNEDDEEKKNAIDQKRLFFKKQEIIKFLVSSNILPKYGFPVDTVDLKVNPSAYTNADNNDTLRLTRDLSQAISDYAPGSKVIANDRMYTSRYILKYVKDGKRDFEKRYIAKCANDNCNTMNCKTLKPEQNVKCIGCGEWISHSKFIEAIYPAAGMAMENKTGERVPLNRPQKVYKTDYYFVEEEMERNSKTIDFGEKQIVIISSQKDTIGISSNLERPFYVCQRCGFSYGINDANRIKDEDNKPDKKAIDVLRGKRKSIYMECAKKHMNPYGKACSNTVLTQNALYHSYHTDIVQIIFKNDSLTLRDSYKTALSVLYALLDAISNVLDIERDEISGVLVKCTNSLFGNNYKFILFDTVPGGAGHVKQLSGDNLDNIHKIFEYAYNKTHDCSCGEDSSCYGCLRTYENQKYHDQLSRKSAYSFLQHYLDYPILHEEYVVNVDATDQNKNDYSWEDLFDTFDFDFTQSLKEILKQLPVPSHMYCDASINNYNLNSPIALYWSDFNVLIIERSKYDLIEEESVKNYIKNGFPESKIFVEGIGIENDKLKKLLERGE